MAIHTGKHLAEALGEDYVSQMCSGALVQMGNEIHNLRGVYERGVSYTTNRMDLSEETPRWTTGTLPQERIRSLADLAYPRLGYREVRDNKYGPIVFHISSPRSAMRGLRIDRLHVGMPASLLSLMPNCAELWHMRRSEHNVKSIYSPTFTPFAVGIRKLIVGECVSFATSEDVAVVMTATAGPDIVAEILFRERGVGIVNGRGEVHLNNKILQKHGLSSKLGV